MYRSMIQIYVKKSDTALDFYQKAFGTKLLCKYINSDGTIAHSELDVFGQIMAVSELDEDNVITGNTMQFCLHFGEGKEDIVKKIYDVLKEDAKIICPLDKCDFSSLMVCLVDKFGVNWCVFV